MKDLFANMDVDPSRNIPIHNEIDYLDDVIELNNLFDTIAVSIDEMDSDNRRLESMDIFKTTLEETGLDKGMATLGIKYNLDTFFKHSHTSLQGYIDDQCDSVIVQEVMMNGLADTIKKGYDNIVKAMHHIRDLFIKIAKKVFSFLFKSDVKVKKNNISIEDVIERIRGIIDMYEGPDRLKRDGTVEWVDDSRVFEVISDHNVTMPNIHLSDSPTSLFKSIEILNTIDYNAINSFHDASVQEMDAFKKNTIPIPTPFYTTLLSSSDVIEDLSKLGVAVGPLNSNGLKVSKKPVSVKHKVTDLYELLTIYRQYHMPIAYMNDGKIYRHTPARMLATADELAKKAYLSWKKLSTDELRSIDKFFLRWWDQTVLRLKAERFKSEDMQNGTATPYVVKRSRINVGVASKILMELLKTTAAHTTELIKIGNAVNYQLGLLLTQLKKEHE